jgi:hypothetical protein
MRPSYRVSFHTFSDIRPMRDLHVKFLMWITVRHLSSPGHAACPALVADYSGVAFSERRGSMTPVETNSSVSLVPPLGLSRVLISPGRADQAGPYGPWRRSSRRGSPCESRVTRYRLMRTVQGFLGLLSLPLCRA